jgi:hypothetical protein
MQQLYPATHNDTWQDPMVMTQRMTQLYRRQGRNLAKLSCRQEAVAVGIQSRAVLGTAAANLVLLAPNIQHGSHDLLQS